MISKFHVDQAMALPDFGLPCQRLIPWTGQDTGPPMGLMAGFLEPASSSAPDCHDQDEVMIILSGHGTVDLAGETIDVSPRDLVVLPGNTEHLAHSCADAPLVWVSLYWPPVTEPVFGV